MERSKCVFVENIPLNGTEQQLIEVFSRVGTVTGFRIVCDDETGKPKGYGFCEFADEATAQSAIRNLKEVDFHGRTLKVDAADSKKHDSKFEEMLKDIAAAPKPIETMKPVIAKAAPVVESSKPKSQPKPKPKAKVDKPLGTNVPSMVDNKMKTKDDITAFVSKMKPEQLIQILSEMKAFIKKDRAGARKLLIDSPQFAQMLLEIQLAFGLVKGSQIQLLYKEQQSNQARVARPAGASAAGRPRAMPRHSVQGMASGKARHGSSMPAVSKPSAVAMKRNTRQAGNALSTEGLHPSRIARMQQAGMNQGGLQRTGMQAAKRARTAQGMVGGRATQLTAEQRKKLQEQKLKEKLLRMTPAEIARMKPDMQKKVLAAQRMLRNKLSR
mmetsp:Transcript_9488/g.13247  ORF Transcript_9488/g.13247 Transcript_9488/m.13247 type:complete len:384 (+) Transcript_9488:154-1305(+)|eukprot:CAMPEP_0184479540 /NCGR_PEP_ID=MMETSP0113_2-20130426/1228_1 /TAXON_ID=91329 /ORGANISM="Norrisiella sphaerica, Strain BC52" /LENGTH=383 /DNA_ID=CAMNT_0026857651 /DNA_START=156 /DNA_END=1307 /DNA_ORIENTATION=+